MGIDASIALQGKLPQLDNPLTQYAQFAQAQGLQNQNQLAQYTLSKAKREDEDTIAQRNLLTGAGGDLEAGYNALLKGGYLDRALAIRKAQQEQLKTGSEISKNNAEAGSKNQEVAAKRIEMIGQTMASLQSVPGVSQQHVVNGLQHLVDIGAIPADQLPRLTAEIPQDPAALPGWLDAKGKSALKVADQMKYTTVDANTAANNRTSLATNAATNATTLATNANTVRATIRGQDKSESTQLTINGINDKGEPTSDVDAMAKGIAEGKLAPINGFALAKPRGQQIMARVMELNPTYDAGDYAAKNNALKGFSTGKEGTALRSFNVAVDHLDTLGTMADALNNKDTRVLNTIGNAWAKQTGAAAPTNFEAVKEIVAKEVVKAIVAGGGGVSEREEISKLMDKANSPAQLKGVITHFRELMDAQRSGLMDQYKRTTGRDDGETVFAPSQKPAKQVAEAVNNGESARLAAAKPVSVKSAADYAKLPPGTVYTAPDGSQRTKQ